MPSISSYGGGFTSTGWLDTANAYDNNLSTFTTLTTTTAGANTTYITGYNFSSLIPENVGISSVKIRVAQYVSGSAAASRWDQPTVRPYVSTTPISTSETLTESTSSSNQQEIIRTDITRAQLVDSNFQIQFVANKNGTSSATQNLGGILVTVEYNKESWGVLEL